MLGIATTVVLQLAGEARSTLALGVIHTMAPALEGLCLSVKPETREHSQATRQNGPSQASCGSISAFLYEFNDEVIPSTI